MQVSGSDARLQPEFFQRVTASEIHVRFAVSDRLLFVTRRNSLVRGRLASFYWAIMRMALLNRSRLKAAEWLVLGSLERDQWITNAAKTCRFHKRPHNLGGGFFFGPQALCFCWSWRMLARASSA
jgi:hypothetical protein